MGESKKPLAKMLCGLGLVALSVLALYYLPIIIAVPIILVALVIMLAMVGGRIRHRRDRRDQLLGEAARRGDSAFFVDPRDHRF